MNTTHNVHVVKRKIMGIFPMGWGFGDSFGSIKCLKMFIYLLFHDMIVRTSRNWGHFMSFSRSVVPAKVGEVLRRLPGGDNFVSVPAHYVDAEAVVKVSADSLMPSYCG